MTLTTDLDTHTIFYTCWDLDILFYERIMIFLSVTASALLHDLLARTTTCPTDSCLLDDTKDCAYLLADLTSPSTSITGRRLPSLPMTSITCCSTLELDFSSISPDRILER